jgi:hypothetical protein
MGGGGGKGFPLPFSFNFSFNKKLGRESVGSWEPGILFPQLIEN